jgi:hypothetical protein
VRLDDVVWLGPIPVAMSLIETGGQHDHRFGFPLSVWTSDVAEEGWIWVVGYRNGDCARLDTSAASDPHHL